MKSQPTVAGSQDNNSLGKWPRSPSKWKEAGEKIRSRRAAIGMTQDDLLQKLAVVTGKDEPYGGSRYVRKIEAGEVFESRQMPPTSNIHTNENLRFTSKKAQ